MLAIWARGTMPKPYAKLGEALKTARHKKGWRQSDLADRSDGRLRQDYISRIESGDHRPEFDKLEAFAETLGLSLNELKILAGYPIVTIEPGPLVVNPTIPAPTVTPSTEYLREFWLSARRNLPRETMEQLEADVVESQEGTEQEDA